MTASSPEEADIISKSLLEKKLIACSNILGEIRSAFWWKNNIQNENEVMIIAKSRRSHLDQIISDVKSLHSYDIPEILAIPIIGGNSEYLEWLIKETDTE